MKFHIGVWKICLPSVEKPEDSAQTNLGFQYLTTRSTLS